MNAVVAADVMELLDEIHRLQKALNFWLPQIPATATAEVFERMEHDACLLVGFDGPSEKSAEELGWVTLQDTSLAPQEK